MLLKALESKYREDLSSQKLNIYQRPLKQDTFFDVGLNEELKKKAKR